MAARFRALIAGAAIVWVVFGAYAEEGWSSAIDNSTTSETVAQAAPDNGDYVVKKDDTMWDIARKFLTNPFKWSDIWRANPSVQNPDLIYPGNRLTIPNGQASGDNSTPVSFGSSSTEGTTTANGSLGIWVTPDSISASQASAVKPIMSDSTWQEIVGTISTKGFFAPDFLSRVGYLVTEPDATGKLYPGNGVIDSCKQNDVYNQFDEFIGTSYTANAYKSGDTITIIHNDEFVKLGAKTVSQARPVGLARITRVQNKTIQAKVYKAWDVIRCRDRIGPYQRNAWLTVKSVGAPSAEIIATVFKRIETTESPYLYQTFILDNGSSEGVLLGDLFEVYPVTKGSLSDRPSLQACAVRVDAHTSTCVIVKMFSNKLMAGDQARCMGRINFVK